ncbi:efflux RND transporter permease subunit [Pajaroellobacter abortibovis]|uniref:efflux RND transporter permease subunit n=1 Tax=Pajaroellobacter abortibovis TaxID=1882918 RepID=UPI00094AADA5|nr:efflux RND transporter permease subunit [Pajaroellobacter abortibovis]
MKRYERLTCINGADAVAFQVVCQSGGNSVAVADAIKAKLATLQPQLPEGISASLLIDNIERIKSSVHQIRG